MRALAAAVVIACAAGCNPVIAADTGWLRPTTPREGHEGVAVNLRGGGLLASDQWSPGGAFGLRTKFAPELIQVAFSEEAIFSATASRGLIWPYVRAGINVLQFEYIEDEFGFGMFSPYAEAGLGLRVYRHRDGTGIVLFVGAAAEYDLRFTDQPHMGYTTIFVGLSANGGARPACDLAVNDCTRDPGPHR